jgi:hypothetical protein
MVGVRSGMAGRKGPPRGVLDRRAGKNALGADWRRRGVCGRVSVEVLDMSRQGSWSKVVEWAVKFGPGNAEQKSGGFHMEMEAFQQDRLQYIVYTNTQITLVWLSFVKEYFIKMHDQV